jgi:hypothetical protein
MGAGSQTSPVPDEESAAIPEAARDAGAQAGLVTVLGFSLAAGLSGLS